MRGGEASVEEIDRFNILRAQGLRQPLHQKR